MIDDSIESVRVRLMAGETVVAERAVPAWAKVFPGHIILACGLSPRSELALGKVLFPIEPVQVVSLTAEELPGIGLDYDSVGAVAMDDPGQALTPSQREALKAWLSGGGKLALTDIKPAGHSLLDALDLPRPAGVESADGGAMDVGLGRVFATQLESISLSRGDDSQAWQAALGLKPYESTHHLNSSHVFSGQGPIAGLPVRNMWSWWLFLSLVLWAGGAIALLILKRGKYAPLLAFSAACLVLAIVGGYALDSGWQRGCRLVSRAVILPASGGVLVDASANMLTPLDTDYETTSVVPWDVSIGFDRVESGKLRPAAPFDWRHGVWKLYFTVRNAEAGAASLCASLPLSILDGTPAEETMRDFSLTAGQPHFSGAHPEGQVAYLSADGSQWWEYSAQTGSWEQYGQIPVWLANDENWILRAHSCLGSYGILVGYDAVPELDLSLQGSAVPGLLWAMPIWAMPIGAMPPSALPAAPEGGR
jgi:hypothetical protein